MIPQRSRREWILFSNYGIKQKLETLLAEGKHVKQMGKINEYLEKLLPVDEILHLIHICRETYIIITALPPFIVDLEHVFSQKNQHHHHCNVEKMKKYTKLGISEYKKLRICVPDQLF